MVDPVMDHPDMGHGNDNMESILDGPHNTTTHQKMDRSNFGCKTTPTIYDIIKSTGVHFGLMVIMWVTFLNGLLF